MSSGDNQTKRLAPARSRSSSFNNDIDDTVDSSDDDPLSLPGTATLKLENGSLTQERKKRRKRKPFAPWRRKEVAAVRKRGACEECRRRKVGCTHEVEEPKSTAKLAQIQKPLPRPIDFRVVGPDLALNHGNDVNMFQPRADEMLHVGSSEHMLASIPTRTARTDKLALDLHDYDFFIGDYQPDGGWENIPQYLRPHNQQPWTSLPSLDTRGQHPLISHTVPEPWSEFVSNAAPTPFALVERDMTSTCANDLSAVFPDNHFSNSFSNEIDMDHHQEAPQFRCHVPHCEYHHKPFARPEMLRAHFKIRHPDFSVSLTQKSSKPSDGETAKNAHQEGITDGIDNSLIALPYQQGVTGRNIPHLAQSRPETASRRDGLFRGPIRGRRRTNRNYGSRRDNSQLQRQLSVGSAGSYLEALGQSRSRSGSNREAEILDSFLQPRTESNQVMGGYHNSAMAHHLRPCQPQYLMGSQPPQFAPYSSPFGRSSSPQRLQQSQGFHDGFMGLQTERQQSGMSGLMQNLSLDTSTPIQPILNQQAAQPLDYSGSYLPNPYGNEQFFPPCSIFDVQPLTQNPPVTVPYNINHPQSTPVHHGDPMNSMPHHFSSNTLELPPRGFESGVSSRGFAPGYGYGYDRPPSITLNGISVNHDSDPISLSRHPAVPVPPSNNGMLPELSRTCSSSGANESLVSPTEAPNQFFGFLSNNGKDSSTDDDFGQISTWSLPDFYDVHE